MSATAATDFPACVAGMKCHWRTADNAAESRIGCPLVSITETSTGVPPAETFTRSTTRPCSPRCRAIAGYTGARFVSMPATGRGGTSGPVASALVGANALDGAGLLNGEDVRGPGACAVTAGFGGGAGRRGASGMGCASCAGTTGRDSGCDGIVSVGADIVSGCCTAGG
jgi:hypothetical protein